MILCEEEVGYFVVECKRERERGEVKVTHEIRRVGRDKKVKVGT